MNQPTSKPIHGERVPVWQRLGLAENPPVVCDFRVGDTVEFTNDYGLKFIDTIIGFASGTEFQGRFIHITPKLTPSGEPTDCWWFPHRPSDLRLLSRQPASP